MKFYKELLLKKLVDSGWQLVSVDDDTEWWLEEYWTIKSIKQRWGSELYVLFLVDPMYEGVKKSQAVWAICADSKVPESRPIGAECPIEMDLQKGKFDLKLSQFVDSINEQRNSVDL